MKLMKKQMLFLLSQVRNGYEVDYDTAEMKKALQKFKK